MNVLRKEFKKYPPWLDRGREDTSSFITEMIRIQTSFLQAIISVSGNSERRWELVQQLSPIYSMDRITWG